jgi:endonuclease/exonuclease/phosphatase family protein
MSKSIRFLFPAVASIVLATAVQGAPAQEVTVMTRNLYLGANLAPVLAAQTPDEFLAAAQTALGLIAANDFPERAQALAAEIVEKQPHLVGLQEVYSFTFNGFNGPPPFRDSLADLISALDQQGGGYRVAAVVRDMDIQVPLGGNVVGVTDRDVILARDDVDTAVVPLSASGCRASVDGCNFQLVVTSTTPLGSLSIERGYVAVDAVVEGTPVRFANTHLELSGPELDPGNPLAAIFQSAQALELVTVLGGFPIPPGTKTILVGDLNSTPEDQSVIAGPYTIVPPYRLILGAGYLDTWLLRPGHPAGLTCCQAENLLNPASALTLRVDMTFTREMPGGMVKANLVGIDAADRTPSGLWPSDHAGLVTRIQY